MTFHVALETVLRTEGLLTAVTGAEEGFLPYRQHKTHTNTFKAHRRVVVIPIQTRLFSATSRIHDSGESCR